ncbi:PIN domain-containing protein [Streptomyces fractus]|uniref:PIN domain-containing protein n=1 Tax=Streptomyces fractus TaxID=641806 RepID=UPI003CF7D3D6
MSDHTEIAALDHTALIALYDADEFFTGLYIEASHQRGRIVIPAASVWAAELARAGAGTHAARLHHVEHRPFTTDHAVQAVAWPRTEIAAAHPAAIAWEAGLAGTPLTVLSLQPHLYASTGIMPLNPRE